MVSIKYLGHSSFTIEVNGRVVLTDPWLDPRPRNVQRLVPPAATSDQIRRADVILVSHEHYDHCDAFDIGTIVNRTFAQVVAPDSALKKLDIPERNRVPAREGDKFELMGVNIEVVEARHPQCSHAVGYIVRGEGGSVYFAGDTYQFPAMNRIDVDVAILPIGGTYTMDMLSALTALKQLRARFVVPMHYNTLKEIRVSPQEFARRVKETTKVEPVVLSVGEGFSI
ncbi:MAG: MBL fold metallo-hydrolase [Candidatus Micrarchaeota archaeon]|nr:MBL fold metallo-hydrolase [Candidatus Micrarchaeota archaeon]